MPTLKAHLAAETISIMAAVETVAVETVAVETMRRAQELGNLSRS